MKKLLMAINPLYVDKILKGEKQFEYRKTRCLQSVKSILIYETSPKKKVVAEVELLDILTASPEIIWEQTQHAAGIDKRFFDDYFNGAHAAIAYVLGNVVTFNEPRSLSYYGVTFAPQSFQYIED